MRKHLTEIKSQFYEETIIRYSCNFSALNEAMYYNKMFERYMYALITAAE